MQTDPIFTDEQSNPQTTDERRAHSSNTFQGETCFEYAIFVITDEGHAHSFDTFEKEMCTMYAIFMNTDDGQVHPSKTNKETKAPCKTIVETMVERVRKMMQTDKSSNTVHGEKGQACTRRHLSQGSDKHIGESGKSDSDKWRVQVMHRHKADKKLAHRGLKITQARGKLEPALSGQEK